MKNRIIAGAAVAAVFGYSVLPSFVLRKIQTRQRKKKHSGKVLYLTFDDGPSKEYTPRLLELLAKYDIKASFFVVSQFASENQPIIEMIKRAGHLVGIHSVKHQNSLFRGLEFTRRDLMQSRFEMQRQGCSIDYYRPPWGHLNLFSIYWAKMLGLKIMFWDVMARDWAPDETAETIYLKIIRRAFPGAVICLHDGRGAKGAPARTIAALERAIPHLLKQGYQLKRLDAYE